MNKLDATYSRLQDELATLDKRREVLRLQLSALEMAGAGKSTGVQTPPIPSKARKLKGTAVSGATKGRKRAPKGALAAAIMEAVKAGPLTNGAVRAKITQDGYAWSLNRLHISKALQKLVKEKRLATEGPASNRSYKLPESAVVEAVA